MLTRVHNNVLMTSGRDRVSNRCELDELGPGAHYTHDFHDSNLTRDTYPYDGVMRVLVVTPWFPSPAHTGAGIFNLRDAQLLARDHEVTVLHLIRPDWWSRDSAVDEIDGIDVTRVAYSASSPGTWRAARSALREHVRHADIVHTMAFPALLAFAGLRIRQPWVHTEHWGALRMESRGAAALAAKGLKPNLRRPDEVVAVSADLVRGIDRWTRRSPHIIGNAVPIPAVGLSSAPYPVELGESDTDDESSAPLRIVSVGGVAAHKGPLLAVQTIRELAAQGVSATLTWVGTGPQRTEAEALAAELGVADRVNFTGQLERSELETELLRSHVFLLPTAGETFGVALAEALACGLPVVTTGQGGHVSLLEPFAAAHLVAREPAALVKGVRAAVAGDSSGRRRETAAQAAAEFSDEARRSAYARVYDAALQASR